MGEKYLLYIDILGFADLVKKSPESVQELYDILDSQNSHRHGQFKTIVFSDTILIYNLVDPARVEDHIYIVMFMIEFAQNLSFSIIGKDYSFRAILTKGQFTHSKPKIVERYFGQALIEAYKFEKNIDCTGLFIKNELLKFNTVFQTIQYSDELSFVLMNQSAQSAEKGYYGALPLDRYALESQDGEWGLGRDLKMFEIVYGRMRNHPNPKVRVKYLATWDFLFQAYPKLLKFFVECNFDPNKVSSGVDWERIYKRVLAGG